MDDDDTQETLYQDDQDMDQNDQMKYDIQQALGVGMQLVEKNLEMQKQIQMYEEKLQLLEKLEQENEDLKQLVTNLRNLRSQTEAERNADKTVIYKLQAKIREYEKGNNSPASPRNSIKRAEFFDVKILRHRVEEQNEEIEQLKQQIEVYEKKINKLEDVKQKNAELEMKIQMYQERLNSIENMSSTTTEVTIQNDNEQEDTLQIPNEPQIQIDDSKLQELMNENTKLNQELSDCKKTIEELIAREKTYLEEVSSLKEKNSNLENQLQELSRVLEATRNQLKLNTQEKFGRAIHRQINELEDHNLDDIFKFLPVHYTVNIALVCKRWNERLKNRMNTVEFWKSVYELHFRPTCHCNATGDPFSFCNKCNARFMLKFHPECFCMTHWNCIQGHKIVSFHYPEEKCELKSAEDWKHLYMDTRLEMSWGIPFTSVTNSKPRCVNVHFTKEEIKKMYKSLLIRKLKEWEYFNHVLWMNVSLKKRETVLLQLCKKYLFAKYLSAKDIYIISTFESKSDWFSRGVTIIATFVQKTKQNLYAKFKYEIYFDSNGFLETLSEHATISGKT